MVGRRREWPCDSRRCLAARSRTPQTLGTAATNSDGRVAELGPDHVEAGTYRLVFDTAAYFAATSQTGFFPEVSLTFTVTDPEQHYHVPVLLSPFGYSTYRGS